MTNKTWTLINVTLIWDITHHVTSVNVCTVLCSATLSRFLPLALSSKIECGLPHRHKSFVSVMGKPALYRLWNTLKHIEKSSFSNVLVVSRTTILPSRVWDHFVHVPSGSVGTKHHDTLCLLDLLGQRNVSGSAGPISHHWKPMVDGGFCFWWQRIVASRPFTHNFSLNSYLHTWVTGHYQVHPSCKWRTERREALRLSRHVHDPLSSCWGWWILRRTVTLTTTEMFVFSRGTALSWYCTLCESVTQSQRCESSDNSLQSRLNSPNLNFKTRLPIRT